MPRFILRTFHGSTRCAKNSRRGQILHSTNQSISPAILRFLSWQSYIFFLIWSDLSYGYTSTDTAAGMTPLLFPLITPLPWQSLNNSASDKGRKRWKGYMYSHEISTPPHSTPLILLSPPLWPPSTLVSFIWRRPVPNHLMLLCDVREWMAIYVICMCVCEREKLRGYQLRCKLAAWLTWHVDKV